MVIRMELPGFGSMVRVPDKRSVAGVDEDNSYSVFISYVEIYNNFVYDLLEEPTAEAILHPRYTLLYMYIVCAVYSVIYT